MRIIDNSDEPRVLLLAFLLIPCLLLNVAEGKRVGRAGSVGVVDAQIEAPEVHFERQARLTSPIEESMSTAKRFEHVIHDIAEPKIWCMSKKFDFASTYVHDNSTRTCNPKAQIRNKLRQGGLDDREERDKDAIKLEMSKGWCEGDITESPKSPWMTYWDNQRDQIKRSMTVERFGVRLQAVPISNTHAIGYPPPTACRSGSFDVNNSDSHAYDITNTYALIYEKSSDNTVLNPLPGLRHGIIGYLKPAKGIDDITERERVMEQVKVRVRADTLRIIEKSFDAASIDFDAEDKKMHHPVSLNLLSKGLGGDDDLIDLQREIMDTTLHLSSQWNFGINFGGRHRVISGSYAKTNYVAMIKATQHVVSALLSLVNDEAMIKARSEDSLPETCATMTVGWLTLTKRSKERSAQLRNRLRIGYATGDGTVPSKDPINLRKELLRISDAIGSGEIEDHRRASMCCVLDQVVSLLELPAHSCESSNCFLPSKTMATTIAGNSMSTKQKSIRVATEMLKKNIYTTGAAADDKYRRGDILRIISLAAFLGRPFWVNCKSGLDRTGIFSPVSAAYAMMLSSMYIDDVDSLSENCVPYLVFLSQHFEDTAYLKDDADASTNCTALDGTKLTMDEFRSGGGIYILREFRKLTLEIAVKHSLPISFLSTGTLGVKWQSGKTGIYDQIVKFFLPNVIQYETGLGGTENAQVFVQASGYRAS